MVFISEEVHISFLRQYCLTLEKTVTRRITDQVEVDLNNYRKLMSIFRSSGVLFTRRIALPLITSKESL